MSWIVAESLTTPCGDVLLLRQHLLRHPLSSRYLDFQPLEQAFVVVFKSPVV